LWKIDSKTYHILIASAKLVPTQIHQYKGKLGLSKYFLNYLGIDIHVIFGDHSAMLQKVADNMKIALNYAANENQSNMVKKYVEHFEGGSIDDHKESQRFWIRDVGPVVETNIGFIESYRDPQGDFQFFNSSLPKF
jgi:dipeptidyl-peptidase-3